jgi:hypothetical protein
LRDAEKQVCFWVFHPDAEFPLKKRQILFVLDRVALLITQDGHRCGMLQVNTGNRKKLLAVVDIRSSCCFVVSLEDEELVTILDEVTHRFPYELVHAYSGKLLYLLELVVDALLYLWVFAHYPESAGHLHFRVKLYRLFHYTVDHVHAVLADYLRVELERLRVC